MKMLVDEMALIHFHGTPLNPFATYFTCEIFNVLLLHHPHDVFNKYSKLSLLSYS